MATRVTKDKNGEKWYKWVVEFEVNSGWVADGFVLTDEKARNMIQEHLPYAFSEETKAKVLRSPSKEAILKEQGY